MTVPKSWSGPCINEFCLQYKDNEKTYVGSRVYSTKAPSNRAKSGYTSGTCNIVLPFFEGTYTYEVDISPGRVVKTVGPITYGKVLFN